MLLGEVDELWDHCWIFDVETRLVPSIGIVWSISTALKHLQEEKNATHVSTDLATSLRPTNICQSDVQQPRNIKNWSRTCQTAENKWATSLTPVLRRDCQQTERQISRLSSTKVGPIFQIDLPDVERCTECEWGLMMCRSLYEGPESATPADHVSSGLCSCRGVDGKKTMVMECWWSWSRGQSLALEERRGEQLEN